MADMDYSQCIEIVEAVMEWIALRWSKSQMKRELREWFPGLSGMTCDFIFSAAKKEIRRRYGINPDEYRGKAIAFYEYVIRGESKMRDKLTAAERLDKLYGLEQLQHEDANTTARKIRDALSQLDNQVIKEKPDGEAKNSVHEGDSEINAGTGGQQGSPAEETKEPAKAEERTHSVDVQVTVEIIEDLKKVKPDQLNDFLKNKDIKRKS